MKRSLVILVSLVALVAGVAFAETYTGVLQDSAGNAFNVTVDLSPMATPTPVPTPTLTPSPTATATPTPTPTPSPAPTPSPTPTPTPNTTVSFQTPANGDTVSGTGVAVKEVVNPAAGWTNFYVDGTYVSSANGTSAAPYSFGWDSTSVSNGQHKLMAIAKGTVNGVANSVMGSATIGVNVQNTPVVIPSPTASPTPAPTPVPTVTASPIGTVVPVPTPTTTPTPSQTGANVIKEPSGTAMAKIQSDIATLKPGDQLLLERGGSYTGGMILTGLNGTAAQRIFIGAYGTGPRPLLDGKSTTQYGFFASSGSYVQVDGLHVVNDTLAGGALHSSGPAMPGWIVSNTEVDHTGAGACAGCGTPHDDGGYNNQLEFLEYGEHQDGVQFVNNIVHDCGGHNCIQVHGDMGGAIISGNTCWGWIHNCIDVKCAVATVEGNVAHGPGVAGAGFYFENPFVQGASITWINNLVYNAPNGFQMMGGQCTGAGGCSNTLVMWNNTAFMTGGADPVYNDGGGNTKADIRNNIFHGGNLVVKNDTVIAEGHNDLVGLASSTFPTSASDLRDIDPMYVNQAGDDYHLQGASPLVGAGDPVVGSDIGADVP